MFEFLEFKDRIKLLIIKNAIYSSRPDFVTSFNSFYFLDRSELFRPDLNL